MHAVVNFFMSSAEAVGRKARPVNFLAGLQILPRRQLHASRPGRGARGELWCRPSPEQEVPGQVSVCRPDYSRRLRRLQVFAETGFEFVE